MTALPARLQSMCLSSLQEPRLALMACKGLQLSRLCLRMVKSLGNVEAAEGCPPDKIRSILRHFFPLSATSVVCSPRKHLTNSNFRIGAMASDEIVWQVINQQFCSFKLKYVLRVLVPDCTTNIDVKNYQGTELLSQRVQCHGPVQSFCMPARQLPLCYDTI